MPDFKLMYLARRNPVIAQGDFPEAWRSHSRLASTFSDSLGSHFRTVRQCVKAYDLDAPPEYRNEYDGCALLQMKSWDDLVAARTHPRSLKEMKDDEARVFAGFVDQWTMAAEEIRLRGDETADHMLLAFLTPAHGVDGAQFAARLDGLCRELLDCAAARNATGITLDRVVDPAPAYGFAAVIEIWFAGAEQMLAAVRDPELSMFLQMDGLADEANSPRLLARLNLAKQKADPRNQTSGWREETP